VLLEYDLNRIFEGQERITSRSGVRVRSKLLEVELDCSLGETVGHFSDFLEMTLVTLVGGMLLLLLALSTLLLLALGFQLL
jgi:hypothetical protein